MSSTITLTDIPPWGWVLISFWLIVHVALAVAALVTLRRTPEERLSAPRAVWIIVAILVQILGPVAFFVIGRRPVTAADPHLAGDATARDAPTGPMAPPVSATQRVIDELYGSEER